MKPMIILPPDTMSDADIAELRKNDVCVVTAEDPAKVRFVDPLPAASSRTQIENAAIQLSRRLLNGQWSGPAVSLGRSDFARLFIDCLVTGTPLDPYPTRDEQERQFFDEEKKAELRRLARAEAKADRDAQRAAAKSEKK